MGKGSAYSKYFGFQNDDYRMQQFRPAPRGMRGKKDIKNLWDLHYEILRLKSLGVKSRKIAEMVGCSFGTVSNTLNSTMGKKHLMTLRGSRDADTVDLMQRIRDFGPKCLDLLEDVIAGKGEVGKDAKPSLRVNAAKDYLNRIPEVSPHSRRDNRTALLTSEDIQNIKQRAMDSGIVDVTPEA